MLACDDEERDAIRAQGYGERGNIVIKWLDNHLAGAQIDVVKMDVEGFEPHVVAGAGMLLTAAAGWTLLDKNTLAGLKTSALTLLA